ncbi:MAG: hypothetical protein IIW10_07320, partial [Spirochaetaceae bacterium]|nr:hypothetical protein [Spirochaetaceae bacterium]
MNKSHSEHESHSHGGCCGHSHSEHESHSHGGCGCGCDHNREIGKSEIKATLTKLASSLVVFISAILLQRGFLPVDAPPYAFVGLFFLAYFLCAFEIFKKAVTGLATGHFLDENALMSVASVAAIFLGEIEEGFAVLFLYNLGEFLQDLSVSRSRKNIAQLMDGRPDVASVKRNEQLETIPAEEVKVGEIFVVKPGGKIPLDGKILSGESFVDERSITGESVPKKKV